MDNLKAAFLETAISDAQATVRAIDVKVGALLILLLAPFANISRVFAHVDKLCNGSSKLAFIVISVVFFGSWLLALIALVMAMGALNNPGDHIVGKKETKGSFYGAGLFPFGFVDVFLNRPRIKARKDLLTFVKDIPESNVEIELELTFEHMKVIYIRDLKSVRLKWGIRLSAVWLALGMLIFLCSRYSICL